MKNLNSIQKIIKKHKTELEQNFYVSKIGIFGSYIYNQQTSDSDVDILIEFKKTPGMFSFIRLENYLSGLLKVKVDLTTKEALKKHIGKKILSEVIYV